MKILTSEQMRNIDRRASEQYLIPTIVLMENAALAVVGELRERFPDAERVAIFCGPGQNGGDGLAVARHLENRGVAATVHIIGSRSAYKGDAKTNLEICERLGIPMHEIRNVDTLDQSLASASQTDLIVDAIFGTGLNRPPEGIFADAIRQLVTLRLPILSVDIPSGLSGDSATAFEPAIKADLTVTFAQPKLPHVFEPGAGYCGEIVVADIGIPHAAVEAEGATLAVAAPHDVLPLIASRRPDTHKGTYGHVLIIAGSEGRNGAAALCARGSIRMGAGLTTVMTDIDTARIVDAVSVESMTLRTTLDAAHLEQIGVELERFDAVLVGPGLADNDENYHFLRSLIERIERPAVIDATGLNAFQGRIEELNPRRRPRVITPHPGELARLLGIDISAVNDHRVEIARDVAARSACMLVLKGNQTLIATPEGSVSVNTTGNAGMATGGMGDVLAGMIAALLASGNDPFESARAAVYVHGTAGDLLKENTSDIGLAALDLADAVPAAVARIRRSGAEPS